MPVIQEHPFDPEECGPDPATQVRALTLAIRSLRLGERVRMPDGSLIASQSVKIGPHQQRRFILVPSEATSTPAERHRAFTLGHSSCKTAEAAAIRALGVNPMNGE